MSVRNRVVVTIDEEGHKVVTLHKYYYFFLTISKRILSHTASPTSEIIGESVTSSSCLNTFKSWLKVSKAIVNEARRTPSIGYEGKDRFRAK